MHALTVVPIVAVRTLSVRSVGAAMRRGNGNHRAESDNS